MNLYGFTESVLNPHRRFKTLEGIYAVCDRDGEAVMTTATGRVDFEVVWQGKPHVLRCILDNDPERTDRLCEMSLYTGNAESPHIVPCTYLEQEMLVFDAADRPVYVDVVLQPQPDGERLDRLVARLARSGRGKALSGAREALARLAVWLTESDFSHGKISARNIFVTPEGNAVLVNYVDSSRRRTAHGDLLALGALTAVLYVVACRPELYAAIVKDKILSATGMKKLSRTISDMMADERAVELKRLFGRMTTMEEAKDALPIKALSDAIVRVAGLAPCRYDSLDRVVATENTDGDRKWSIVGEMHNMLIRAFDGRTWTYLDKHGRDVFGAKFLDARDFAEGRAVVETDTGYGLVDLNGNFVIAPRFDDIEWDSSHNVAIVTDEGLSGLTDRDGKPLTGCIYDQIVGGREGLFLVKQNGLFGYIHRDGRMAIKPRFNDAFSFRDGRALVRIADREFFIDRNGNEAESARRPLAKLVAVI